mmetsp:Transcript_5550/g.15491  ORF Transcript_5550/g.15491 Transcript_5550/m.15491 type:complete len:207 (+) Transcript_5550:408-1028(+)
MRLHVEQEKRPGLLVEQLRHVQNAAALPFTSVAGVHIDSVGRVGNARIKHNVAVNVRHTEKRGGLGVRIDSHNSGFIRVCGALTEEGLAGESSLLSLILLHVDEAIVSPVQVVRRPQSSLFVRITVVQDRHSRTQVFEVSLYDVHSTEGISPVASLFRRWRTCPHPSKQTQPPSRPWDWWPHPRAGRSRRPPDPQLLSTTSSVWGS